MYFIKRLQFPSKKPEYLCEFSWFGDEAYWCSEITDAMPFTVKEEALLLSESLADSVVIEPKFRCRLWLDTVNRYAYIKDVIGESTVTWTDEPTEAGVFSSNQSRLLSLQYQTEIEAI